jgi:hypothetical protein
VDGVEFVADDDPVEALPPRPKPGRSTWVARVTAVVAAAAAIVVWVVTRPATPSPTKATAKPATRPATKSATKRVPPLGLTLEETSALTCRLGAPVDNSVTDAMHRFLHDITIENMLASRCISGTPSARRVVSELIEGSTGRYDVQVSISNRNADFQEPISRTGGGLRQRKIVLGEIEVESAGVKVRITAVGFPDASPPAARLQRLADFLSLNTVL